MIFRPKRKEFFIIKKKKNTLKSLSFTFGPNTPEQRKMGWKMNQIHNQWNSNTFHFLSFSTQFHVKLVKKNLKFYKPL